MRIAYIVCMCTLVLAALPAQAQVVFSDSFESPVAPYRGLISVYTGQTFSGWYVASGDVEIINGGFWYAGDGSQSVDMSGVSAGSIYRDIPTSAGSTYRLSFLMSGNSEDQSIKTLAVSWGGSVIASPSYNTAGRSWPDIGYIPLSYTVVAQSPVTRLQFTSLNPGVRGPVLDGVSLELVPEPAGILALFCGIVGLVGRMWRARPMEV